MELVIYRKGCPHIVLYDECDHHFLSLCSSWSISSKGYAIGLLKSTKKRIPMHRLFMGVTDSKTQVDHKNRVKTDNRRLNLRFCNNSENQRNREPRGSSRFLGVDVFIRYRKHYVHGPYISASIVANGKKRHLGRFKTEEDAARAYDKAAKIHHGEFANLNFKNE